MIAVTWLSYNEMNNSLLLVLLGPLSLSIFVRPPWYFHCYARSYSAKIVLDLVQLQEEEELIRAFLQQKRLALG